MSENREQREQRDQHDRHDQSDQPEKVLFELRIQTDDEGTTRLEVTLSPEWEAYHRAPRDEWRDRREEWRDRREAWRNRRAEWRNRYADWAGWADDDHTSEAHDEPAPTVAEDLRNALDSLQTIYDDLYGGASA